MPIEIRELNIKVNIAESSPASGGSSAAGNPGLNDQQAIIAACVEQVLDILKQQKER
ncbi:MAG TPA: DUF5908 family protein [Saprospiraceae bacterium]|nr:DUF5908 family protein [Saprospiraceae bacterium]